MKTRLLLIIGILAVFSACHVIRGLTYWYADLGDVNKFPAASLQKSTTPFQFKISDNYAPEKATHLDTLLGKETNTVAFIVIRNDSILYENYWEGYGKNSNIPSFSVAKSFVSTLVGIAIDEGFIKSTKEPIVNYIPELLKNGEKYAAITIQDCLDMRSGLDNKENYGGVNMFSPMVEMYYGNHLDKTVFNAEIGTERGQFNYQSINTQVLGMIVERATKTKLQDYLQQKIWQPLGMQYDASWSVDSKKRNTVKAFAALNAAPIDFAKLGRLFLNNGNWNGQQIINENWVKTTTNFDTLYTNGYKNQWWASEIAMIFEDSLEAVNYKKANPYTSRLRHEGGKVHWLKDSGKAYMAEGILNQFIYVRPDKNMIIVRMGDYPDKNIRVGYAGYDTDGFLGYVSELY